MFNVAKRHSMRVVRPYSHKQNLHVYTLHQQFLQAQTYSDALKYFLQGLFPIGMTCSDCGRS